MRVVALGLAAAMAVSPGFAATGHTAWNEISMDQEQCLETRRAAFGSSSQRPGTGQRPGAGPSK
jgi:hypothetical protein